MVVEGLARDAELGAEFTGLGFGLPHGGVKDGLKPGHSSATPSRIHAIGFSLWFSNTALDKLAYQGCVYITEVERSGLDLLRRVA